MGWRSFPVSASARQAALVIALSQPLVPFSMQTSVRNRKQSYYLFRKEALYFIAKQVIIWEFIISKLYVHLNSCSIGFMLKTWLQYVAIIAFVQVL